MKSKSLVLPILISILPLGLVILNLLDLYDIFAGQRDYPFGSDFVGGYSIYSSKETYVFYTLLFTLLLIVTIFFLFKRNWKLFFIVLMLDTFLFCYPIFTNTL